ASARLGDRVAEILRDVLERPDVQVGGGVLDDLLQIRGDRHACTASSSSAQRSATSSGVERATSAPDAQRATSNSPPPASSPWPVTGQAADARKTTPGATCSGSSSPGSVGRVKTRVAAAGATALARIPCGSPSAATTNMRPTAASFPVAYAASPGLVRSTAIARPDVVKTKRP